MFPRNDTKNKAAVIANQSQTNIFTLRGNSDNFLTLRRGLEIVAGPFFDLLWKLSSACEMCRSSILRYDGMTQPIVLSRIPYGHTIESLAAFNYL